jgi:hypothetical protein
MNYSLRIGIFALLAKAAINVARLFLLVTIRSFSREMVEREIADDCLGFTHNAIIC